MTLKKLVAQTLRSTGLTQRKLASKIGVSHGTISNILSGDIPRNTSTLQKFAVYFGVTIDDLQDDGNGSIREDPAQYLLHHAAARRIVTLIEQLDHEEIATLERCAEAFARSSEDVRQHLIGQLKIIERLVQHEQATGPPVQKAKGDD